MPVEFGTYVAKNTTRAELTKSTLGNFGVFGYYTKNNNWSASEKPDFMYNQLVYGGTGKFTYSPTKYWSNNASDKFSFFAYAPYFTDGTITTGSGTALTSSFTPADASAAGEPVVSFTNMAEGTDLMWANEKDIVGENQGITDKVLFKFKHASSRIGGKIYARVNVDKVNNAGKIEGVVLGDETTVTLTALGIWTEAAAKYGKTGSLNLNTGALTVTDDGTTAAKHDIVTGLTGNVELNKDHSGAASKRLDITDKVTSGAPSSFIILPPKDASTDKLKVKVKATYKVKTTDSNLGSGGYSEITNTDMTGEQEFQLVAGKDYHIVVVLGLTSVKFEIDEIDEWTTGTEEQEVDVPDNKS